MITRLKSKLFTRLFVEWIQNEVDIEALEISKVMIQQRQDFIMPTKPNLIGFRITNENR